MPHKTITPQRQAEYESLLHIHRINKTPLTPLQAVEACHKLIKGYTFIASEQTLLQSRSCSISVFDDKQLFQPSALKIWRAENEDKTAMVLHIFSQTGFEELLEKIKKWAADHE